MQCHILSLSILDSAMGMDMAQGNGMVLAIHLMKLLKSFRRFTDIITKKFDDLKNIKCLRFVHDKLKTVSSYSELKPHLFSFLYPGAEVELSSLYKCVVSSMSAIHSGARKPCDLIQIAQLWWVLLHALLPYMYL